VEPLHLDRPFDYLVPDDLSDVEVAAGQRVLVDFAGRRVRAVVLELTDDSEVPEAQRKPIVRTLGDHVWLRDDERDLLRWLADRTGAPLGDVIRHALPDRVVEVERKAAEAGWFPPGSARRPRSDPAPDRSTLHEAWSGYGDGGPPLEAPAPTGDRRLMLAARPGGGRPAPRGRAAPRARRRAPPAGARARGRAGARGGAGGRGRGGGGGRSRWSPEE
jgi:primosomal protein N' (replication factor Y) (superfamily II helicase)